MVQSSRIEGGVQVLSAGVRRTIQSIKEVVRNHSDADIYVALKENNMDPDETIQRLLNQDPFHLVKRRRDRRTENKEHKSSAATEARKNIETVRVPVKYNPYVDHNSRRGGTGRNVASGASTEFRVVRDNRMGQFASNDSKPAQSSTSTNKEIALVEPLKSSGHQKPRTEQLSSLALNGSTEPQPGKVKVPKPDSYEKKEMVSEKHLPVPNSSQVQLKANESQPHSSDSPSSSAVGVYSSSSDPVHVPSPNSRPAANIGAIRREVGVVGPRRLSSEDPTKHSSSQTSSLPYTQSAQDGHLKGSSRSIGVSKIDKSSQNMAPESVPGRTSGRPASNNQYSRRAHQIMGHQKAPQPNKEWKPKSSANGPGVIKTPAQPVSPPADNSEDTKKETVPIQDNMSRLNLSENQNVIIAAHIHVSESDRSRLTFGSLGTQLNSSINSVFMASRDSEELSSEPSESLPMSAPESSASDPASSTQLKITDASVQVQSPGSSSHPSGVESDQQSCEKKESISTQHLENYADVGLVRDNSPSYNSEPPKQQETSELPSFSGYELQMDMSYFHPVVDETMRGPGLPSPQEVLSTHLTNSVPSSTMSLVQQQQQQQIAQMYSQMHASQYANLMPYRQFLSPVYVPPMPVPAYSNNPAYPHPSNGSSYLLMPGSNSHLTQNGVKYGMQQFKPVPTGTSPSGFGNFTSPAGYAISTPGLVGSTEDACRLKYKDSLYIPNPQAETSEIWMNPRDIPALQSAPYYNITGQTPHGAYLTSHSGQVSYNPAAAAQSSHMQFPGMYHPQPQPNPLGPTMGGNVGVGVAASAAAAQVGAYQQPQMGHMNWTGNF